jgi:hypothetical protein
MKYINSFLVLVVMVGGLCAMQPDLRALGQGDEQADVAQNVCPICWVSDLDNARADNPTFSLLCGHRFCRACITQWLDQRYECPICKRRFERGLHWPLMDHHIDRIEMINNIATWTPTVSLVACFSAMLFLIIRKLTEG